MDATTAMTQTNALVADLLAKLTPDQGELATPCDQWTVNELIAHMCGSVQGVASALQSQAPSAEVPDVLASGPASAWAVARTSIEAAVTPGALAAVHQMPFGEVPGEIAVAAVSADGITHVWDLAQATGLEHGISDELATFALGTWKSVVPAEGRTGDGFKTVVEPAAGATIVDQLVGYTGRDPAF